VEKRVKAKTKEREKAETAEGRLTINDHYLPEMQRQEYQTSR